ncbi:glycoside hydrolase [Rhizodiscina lignyota]|uniref:Alpha-glucosidase n=1 Tax=Rhizodiscina lignyota TaxID=1504668 RepID=A0A9P4I709_9PEZI|nr:glycoside hydrolase [Rhizodiscina lignyota]
MAPFQHEHNWWKEGVVYQIYPKSFKDSNGDGVGDIPGIISKLDYLKDLGIDIVWVSPHYKSPMIDNGYDISDYEAIYEPFGTLADAEALIKAVHDRGMRLIFDLVINHTSSEHAWFKESRSSKTNPKRDWYIWRPARYDSKGKRCRPNNWRSNFSESAWTWDEQTQEYYLHLYASEQPDLNWENPETRRAIYASAMKFWLDKGIDGFRIDTVNMYSKTPGLPDAPIMYPDHEIQPAFMYYANGPRMHEFLDEMNDVFEPYDTFTVGETPYTPDEGTVLGYIVPSPKRPRLSVVFNFNVVDLGQTPGNRFDERAFTKAHFKRELLRWHRVTQDTGAWNAVFLENHDQPRSVSKFASDAPEYRDLSAKMFAIVLATLSGTLFVYQGQEIGMINAPKDWARENYKCIKSVNHLAEIVARTNDDPAEMEKALGSLHRQARDHGRVPMQWTSDGKNGGFCDEGAEPWIPMLESHRDINVAGQVGRQDSVLEFWRRMLLLRKQFKDVFVYGCVQGFDSPFEDEAKAPLQFVKHGKNGMCSLTVANLTDTPVDWQWPGWVKDDGMVLLAGNYEKGLAKQLQPFEARVYVRAN